MDVHHIFKWFYLHFDRTECNHAIIHHKKTKPLGSGRHFQAWSHKEFALCEGKNLPQNWSSWMQKVASLGPQKLIPPFELLNDHTIVMPKLQHCRSVADNSEDSIYVNAQLKKIKLQINDLQIGTFQGVPFVYDWSDLKAL
ncbi:MAG: hypothetical protein AB8C84_09010 [Oligoflexales bacterium]